VTGRDSLAALRRLQATTRPAPLRSLGSEVDQGVDSILMQALTTDPANRPSPDRLVRALERAQARVVAAAGQCGETMGASVGGWRVLGAGLGLAAFGLWTRLRKRRNGSGNPTELRERSREEEQWRGDESSQ